MNQAMGESKEEALNLVVFSDDWGRHPSSSQHLVRHLMRRGAVGQVLWVNTIGTRGVRLSWGDAKRVCSKICDMLGDWGGGRDSDEDPALPEGLRVIDPVMWPGFRAGWQRGLNRRQVVKHVRQALGQTWVTRPLEGGGAGESTSWVGVTTLPITADVVEPLREVGIERWVYYCVDDFSVWPGLDGDVMDAMERSLVGRVDEVVAVSETLVERVGEMLAGGEGRQEAKVANESIELMTHGVDLAMWSSRGERSQTAKAIADREGKQAKCVFWGLIDERLELDWLSGHHDAAAWMLVGPNEHPGLGRDTIGVSHYSAVGHGELPAIAAAADVLVMPYRDMPVTRAMQPLKLLEYLATYKPVVVRRLPATEAWSDCCDVVDAAEDFVRLCQLRAEQGLPADQRAARESRLVKESWSEKSRQLERVLRGH